MKNTIIGLMLLLVGSNAEAGGWRYSCRSADGEIEFTRMYLVARNVEGQIANLDSYINEDNNTFLEKGEALNFKSHWDSVPGHKVTILAKSKEKKIAGEVDECGGGYETKRYQLSTEVELFAKKKVQFTCTESFSWHGRCK